MSDDKILFQRHDLLGSDPSKSRFIRRLLEDEGMEDILQKQSERRQLIDAIRAVVGREKYVKEGHVRQALAQLKYGTSDSISMEEAEKVRKGIGLQHHLRYSDISNDREEGSDDDIPPSSPSSGRTFSGLPF